MLSTNLALGSRRVTKHQIRRSPLPWQGFEAKSRLMHWVPHGVVTKATGGGGQTLVIIAACVRSRDTNMFRCKLQRRGDHLMG